MNKFIKKLICVGQLGLACLLALPMSGRGQMPAQSAASPAAKAPTVVVVLAGGGAKGFAHLSVLRQLEKDGIKISRIVGTSMGAVIGGLYAAGMSTDDIEEVVGGLDPSKVALDQLNRLELPPRTRAYQRQYPIDLEFGVKQGGLSFARGMSDGQRFLGLLQHLTTHIPSAVDFNDLKIPFRAVATRFRDGETHIFDRGALHLAIRASMAAPAVFAPVEIDGESYVDGGLVANLPIEVALKEGADVIIASYLGQQEGDEQSAQSSNALTVANRMLDILIRQNEKRNLALLREGDILITPHLKGVGFSDFNRAAEIIARGNQAVQEVQGRWQAMSARVHQSQQLSEPARKLSFDEREKRIVEIRPVGNQDVPASYIEAVMSPLLGKDFASDTASERVDWLYTSGYFERVSYSLSQIRDEQYTLLVHVQEKPYGPHFFKTSLGFSTEQGGMNQFSMGVGYRRPWLTASGLELGLDARFGTQSEFSARLYQPLGLRWGAETAITAGRNTMPVYAPDTLDSMYKNKKLAYVNVAMQSLDAQMVYEWDRKATVKLGWTQSGIRYDPDTVFYYPGSTTPVETMSLHYNGLKLQLHVDQLDSWSFPTQGYALTGTVEEGLSGNPYRNMRVSGRWAMSHQAHILNLGFNLGRDTLPAKCGSCNNPSNLFLGGFQFMGAYRMAQLAGDQLAHAQATYMYRLSDGGILKQRTFVGTVLEAGDAWYRDDPTSHVSRYSASLFVAIDSKIGDIYLGAARGTRGASNAFLQLGRRFSF
jgi:NTE family protein